MTPHTVVVGGGGYWGSGPDLAAAKARFRREGGRLSSGYTVLKFYEGTTFEGVDTMGRVYWHGDEPETIEVPRKRPVRSRS